jgi:hypothetical protein
MSSRIRFSAARDVVEAFKDLRRIAPAPADASAPLDYVRQLSTSRRPIDAILFLAYLLPRREAVWWARQCVGAILGPRGEDEALRAADAWVRAPEEERRRAALAIGMAGEQERPTTWLALAAGRSGGSVSALDQKPIVPSPAACAQAANAAIVLAICGGEPKAIGAWVRACVEAGVRFAEGAEARVVAPRSLDDRPPGAAPARRGKSVELRRTGPHIPDRPTN